MPHDPTPATDRLRDLHRSGPRSRTNPPDPGHHAILPTRISALTAHQPHASSQVSAICSPKTSSSAPSQVVSRLTPDKIPAGAARSMVRLHTPEAVDVDRGLPRGSS